MGRSSASCLRLIPCAGGGDGDGGDSPGKHVGDLNVYENKSSGDKRGWSFRKKSTRNRGLSNNVVLETPASRARETLETALLKSPENNNVPEKSFTVQSTDEKTQLPVPYVAQPTEEKTQLPVPCAVQEDEMQVPVQGGKEETDEKTELPVALESKGVETDEKTELPVPLESKGTETDEKTELPVPLGSKGTETDEKTELPVPLESKGLKTDEKAELPVPLESKVTETDDDVNRAGKETESEVNLKEMDDGDAVVIEKDTDFKVESGGSETADVIRTIKEDGERPDESVVILIQSAIRGFLARRGLLKQKKVVRLQAAVRGHLVRRHAVGSLRVVQAIVKMQALVRTRCARQSTEDSSRGSAIQDEAIRMNKTNMSSAPVEKLLQNKFARHLMESTPKTKHIRIKCDPSKPSTAWNWLERWMYVSSAEKTSEADLSKEEQEIEKTENVASPAEVSSIHDSLPREIEESLTDSDADKINQHQVELYDAENASESDVVEAPAEVDSYMNQSHPIAANDLGSLRKEPEFVDEQPKHSLKRKASNPSFIAAQSKFEELTSSTGSNKTMTLSCKDVAVGESKTDGISLEGDNTETPKELSTAEDESKGVIDQLGGHESVTEVSISSMLETPDKRSEVRAVELKNEAKLPEQGSFGIDKAEDINVEVKDTTLLDYVEDSQEKVDHVNKEVGSSVVSETEQEPEANTPDAKKKQPETKTGYQQVHSFSPEASSPMTIPESQATPASQASSVKAKKDKTEKSGSSQKQKASKKTTSHSKHDSGGANSVEQQSGKDHKSGKRRNSFGCDQEPRDSSSSGNSTLPRFMQPTESARAKVQEHNSPRSSPDVKERDSSGKKRHSLPAANGKQGSSPRVQRSISQTQQATKEKKWQR